MFQVDIGKCDMTFSLKTLSELGRQVSYFTKLTFQKLFLKATTFYHLELFLFTFKTL